MNKQLSTTSLLIKLWKHLSRRRRTQFSFLLILVIISSVTEIFSIGTMLPFLSALTNPQQVLQISFAQPFINLLQIRSSENLLFALTVLFVAASLTSAAFRTLLAWASTKITFSTGAEISTEIYRRTLYQPYAVHVSRNSSELINGIVSKTNSVIFGTIAPTLALISAVFMLLVILIFLISIEPLVSFTVFIGFGIIYFGLVLISRAKKIHNSKYIATESTQVIKSLQEGLGGIRDVLIDGNQLTYCAIYQEADQRLRNAQASNAFISQAPRYSIEALGMVLIATVAYFIVDSSSGLNNAIPVLGMMALGAQRLLPLMQQAYYSWSSIVGGQASLEDTINLLNQPLPQNIEKQKVIPLRFNEHIILKSLSFRFSNELPWVLNGLSLHIDKGSRIGIIGSTGSGKSTLLDIVMGLLEPTEGTLEIDGQRVDSSNNRAWQVRIAHVPQSIFLADSTIEENIAFGQPSIDIDHERVRKSAIQAQLASTIDSLPDGYKTKVGERGIKLSGGQRQRIGIARALYKNADVIIFDEATSALDNDTEKAVMDAIEHLSSNLTILIVAHRLTTLKNCTQIVEIEAGNVNRIGSYEEIIGSSHNFH